MNKTQHISDSLSDTEILHRSIERPWMFEMLVKRYQKAFLRKSMKILRSSEMAEDAVQETFLKIYKNAAQFSVRPGASFSSWAYKILLNVCWTEVERQRRHEVQAYDFADLDVAGSSIDVVRNDASNHSYIESVFARMPASLSRFLRLYFIEDKSQREIAFSEGMSEVAVRSRIHRAKQSFKTVALNLDPNLL